MKHEKQPAENALLAWNDANDVSIQPIQSGNINPTWKVLRGNQPVGVLQQLNRSIFEPEVHLNIFAVTRHLAAKGLTTPVLQPTSEGSLWHTDSQQQTWRRLSWVGDTTIDRITSTNQALEAGRFVGEFHRVTADFNETFGYSRGEFHNTPRFLSQLDVAIANHPSKTHHRRVSAIRDEIHSILNDMVIPNGLPVRLVHGDLKISNIRFTGARATALIDLDTLAYGTIDSEMGDALRSWCNQSNEDDPNPSFNLDYFRAALEGYATANTLTDKEWHAIPSGTLRITLELCARFAADALNDCYFGFNPKFGSRVDHNLIRAEGQLKLAKSIIAVFSKMNSIVITHRAVTTPSTS